ncbi:hypothetical protein [Sneathiella sp. HT1-7]|uniref:hypothetical protein n=1 Tax=Sneathiella sp. HT1-7 TaxID=2887192 RepID=UPI001D13A8C5|nr:hypothetical protein [Sneathiella sp. HT1-7]MCC3304925.1 hypothetical protein [Sneathiella sp. HT1-7]
MKDWAAHQFHLSEEVGPGITRAAANRQLAKTTGREIADIAMAAPPPSCIAHVWGWFLVLLPLYAEGPLSRPALIAADIEARFGLRPAGFEVGLLLDLFTLWRRLRPRDAEQG